MNEQLLAAVTQYGAPALFGIVAIAALGAPLPITLLLIVVGSMVSQGAMNLWWAVAAAASGSILGDQAGYAIGRWGGSAAVGKIASRFGGKAQLDAMEAKARAWGGPGIYITRWLLTPLGSCMNFACGTAAYPWHKFFFWYALGEVTGAAVYISLGHYFSDRVMALDGVLGDVTWAAGALIAAVYLGYRLWLSLRRRTSIAR